MKNLKAKNQKGFSLVELMVVIAIIAILAAVAIPMYSNYTTRAKLGTELAKLGGAKADAAEYIANHSGNADYTTSDLASLPSGATVDTNGRIDLNTASIVSGSEVQLTPTVGSGAITWACNISGVDSSQAPSNCTVS